MRTKHVGREYCTGPPENNINLVFEPFRAFFMCDHVSVTRPIRFLPGITYSVLPIQAILDV